MTHPDAHILELAVVGSVNKVKSSLVTTLCEIDSGLVDPLPRSTRVSTQYAYDFSGAENEDPLFRLVDTPGFQQAREALAWVRERVDTGMVEPDAIREFVRSHEGGKQFTDEWRLLKPLLDGAGILYVVDGSAPFNPAAMAEMDLLRMTGRPRLAVINQTHPDRDFSDELRDKLSPYFKVVSFNTHRAGWPERLALWQSFRGIDDAWAPVIDLVIDALRTEVRQRRKEAATATAKFLADMMRWQWKHKTPKGSEVDSLRQRANEAFLAYAANQEQRLRATLRRLYRHRRNLEVSSATLPPHLDLPITDSHSWRVFGLKPTRLLQLGVVSGAASGLAIDTLAGGTTHLLPTLSGAVAGGVLALAGTNRFLRTKISPLRSMGKEVHEVEVVISAGNDSKLPFVLLDRALQVQTYLENLSHANRGVPDVPAEGKLASITLSWDGETVREMNRLLNDLKTNRKSRADAEHAFARRIELAMEVHRPL